MTELDETTEPVDGRVARRRRNIDAVIDVVMEMFIEDMMFPTIEQAATRSGLSLRSLYRYFADQGELVEAAIKRNHDRASELARLHAIGQGPIEQRIEDFVAARIRVYEAVGPVYRATIANAAHHARIRDERAKNRDALLEQFELQFAPELDALEPAARQAAVAAGDLLTQMDAVDYLRHHRQLSVAEIHDAMALALDRLLR